MFLFGWRTASQAARQPGGQAHLLVWNVLRVHKVLGAFIVHLFDFFRTERAACVRAWCGGYFIMHEARFENIPSGKENLQVVVGITVILNL